MKYLIFIIIAWLVKDTPVLIARYRTVQAAMLDEGPKAIFERDMRWHKIFNVKQGAKSLAVAAAMISTTVGIAVPI
jgi:hypothetical protein